MSPTIRNQAKLAGIALAAGLAWTASADVAVAQSGNILTGGRNAPVCMDIGTQLQCTVKVAGLGGETFTVLVTASGIATVECLNPAGNRAPGQDTEVTAGGSVTAATPRNGAATVTVTTDTPTVTGASACPNPRWTAVVTDVAFGDATITLLENGDISDEVTVPLS